MTPPNDLPNDSAIAVVLEPRERDLGDGFFVRRALPAGQRRAVGPFIFFDHFGPTRLAAGVGMDVRPHPHINLATVTYLYEGEILHRDSLGSVQVIRPGDLNWMNAGRGIVHSERTPDAARAAGATVHGLQLWVGLPRAHEESAPAFAHHAAATLPTVRRDGADVRVLVGEAFGLRSPVATFSPVLYLDVRVPAGGVFDVPTDADARAVYVVAGELLAEGRPYATTKMLVLAPGRPLRVESERGARFVVVGGAPFPEPRHLWWNFASSSQARLAEGRHDWLARRGDPDGPFPSVPGDELEFIPAPEGP
ncbi:MAG: pirin family protein [Myxococcales bacterium]|nr:pirin family protein [Myxococcales bacterium]